MSALPMSLVKLPAYSLAAFALIWMATAIASAQDPSPPDTGPALQPVPAAGDDLSVKQAQLADRFKRLEEVVARLAELSASNDPRRARLLREAIARSREQDVTLRFETIVDLLEEERLAAAASNQSELQSELDALLTLLLKADRDRELSSQRDRVRQYLKKVSELIRQQKGVRARTEGGDELPSLSQDQKRIASDTGKLGGDISKTDGKQPADAAEPSDEKGNSDKAEKPSSEQTPKSQSDKDAKDAKPSDDSKEGKGSKSGSESSPSESDSGSPKPGKPSDSPSSKSGNGKPSPSQSGQGESEGSESGDAGEDQQSPQEPADRAAQRLRDAQRQMDEALKKLDEAERKGAADKQREALKELELAKAELERVLRQLREEEMERTLTQLATRFRRMLEAQTVVYEGTVRLDKIPAATRDHDDEIEAARLSRQEREIAQDAEKALLLLREEGSSVAFPEAVEQMRDDMQDVAVRLAEVKVDEITQGLERDIIETLEETIAALEKAKKDLEKNRTPPGQQPAAGQPPEPPLVNKLAELKMIRSLQMRINMRTQRYGKMIDGEQAQTADLIEALRELAEKQQRVRKATSDLQEGRND